MLKSIEKNQYPKKERNAYENSSCWLDRPACVCSQILHVIREEKVREREGGRIEGGRKEEGSP